MAGSRSFLALVAAGACLALGGTAAAAEWRPPGLQPTTAALADVLAANAAATGRADPGFARRRERWTYANGPRRLAVAVAVRDDDFRADVALGAARYAAGRHAGARWRADANGIAHATLSDLQGDALDRLPQSPFGWAAADCALAGQTRGPAPAWVIADRPAGDKPHWFFVDQASGLIVREVTREGARTVVTEFDRFEPVAGTRRPRRWTVSDGDPAHDLAVTVEAVEPEPVDEAAVELPAERRVFAPLAPAAGAVRLPARFRGRDVLVDVAAGGRRLTFVLDTGTASVTLDSGLAGRLGLQPALEHATVPRLAVGGLVLDDASVLAIPLHGIADGILGYDFFFGHVVHVDYARRVVEVLPRAAAEPVFRDPATAVLAANVGEGLPLVAAGVGAATGDRFALDTGSDRLVVLDPFARRYPSEVAHWARAAFGRAGRGDEVLGYLEGSVRVAARRVEAFALGPAHFTGATVALEVPGDDRPDALDIPLDGIVGTDELAAFDCWFDYDGGRVGLRRSAGHS